MDHKQANAIFTEIRDRPYGWSCQKDVAANNCYFKGIELLQRLGILGYKVRGRVGETYMDAKIPDSIRQLYPTTFQLTHFFVEAEIDGAWRVLDPSYDPPLVRHGFIVNDWASGQTCFDITHLYSQEEQIAYAQVWSDPDYATRYFEAIYPCATALNAYFEKLRNM